MMSALAILGDAGRVGVATGASPWWVGWAFVGGVLAVVGGQVAGLWAHERDGRRGWLVGVAALGAVCVGAWVALVVAGTAGGEVLPRAETNQGRFPDVVRAVPMYVGKGAAVSAGLGVWAGVRLRRGV